jgi:hypothetical protein
LLWFSKALQSRKGGFGWYFYTGGVVDWRIMSIHRIMLNGREEEEEIEWGLEAWSSGRIGEFSKNLTGPSNNVLLDNLVDKPGSDVFDMIHI